MFSKFWKLCKEQILIMYIYIFILKLFKNNNIDPKWFIEKMVNRDKKSTHPYILKLHTNHLSTTFWSVSVGICYHLATRSLGFLDSLDLDCRWQYNLSQMCMMMFRSGICAGQSSHTKLKDFCTDLTLFIRLKSSHINGGIFCFCYFVYCSFVYCRLDTKIYRQTHFRFTLKVHSLYTHFSSHRTD